MKLFVTNSIRFGKSVTAYLHGASKLVVKEVPISNLGRHIYYSDSDLPRYFRSLS